MSKLDDFYLMHRSVEMFRRRLVADFWHEHHRKSPLRNASLRMIYQLQIIYALQPCSLQMVMLHLNLSKSAASIAVDKLCELNMVERERSGNDRREMIIRIAPEILPYMNMLTDNFHQIMERDMVDLSVAEQATVEEASRIIVNKLCRSSMLVFEMVNGRQKDKDC